MTERLQRVLGVRSVRLQVLHHVAAAGEVTAGDVMAELGLSRNGVRNHLRELEAEGLLRSTMRRRDNRRSVVVWTADLESIEGLVDDLDLYLLSGP